jgi:hypothetical protein
MDKKFEALIDSAYVNDYLKNKNKRDILIFSIEKFTMVGVEVKGVLVCDKSGLSLASKYLLNILRGNVPNIDSKKLPHLV